MTSIPVALPQCSYGKQHWLWPYTSGFFRVCKATSEHSCKMEVAKCKSMLSVSVFTCTSSTQKCNQYCKQYLTAIQWGSLSERQHGLVLVLLHNLKCFICDLFLIGFEGSVLFLPISTGAEGLCFNLWYCSTLLGSHETCQEHVLVLFRPESERKKIPFCVCMCVLKIAIWKGWA